jgi:tRNA-Thr(GGU) m(6)t(6)A37 methyltransferase TsaA
MQGSEGAPDALIRLSPTMQAAAADLRAGQDVLVLTWLHRAGRDTLAVHPRDDPRTPLTGVFSTRSPDRPNPVGLHPVRIKKIDGLAIQVGPLEAIDGTPVIDIKPRI